MKIYHSILAMLLAGVLFLSCVPAYAITSAEKENNYKAAILQLETYLESYGNDSTELLGIAVVFEDLHGYAKSTSFVNYISVLMKIADGEYDSDMDFLLSMLEVNEGFKKYLEDMRNDSSIGTINELEAYARARECEHNGNTETAMENYRQCLDFFDSQHRLTALYNAGNETAYASALEKIQAGDYAGAYYVFSEISRYGHSAERMKAIVNLLGYTPKDVSDNLKPVTELKITKATIDEMTLSWQKSSHAQRYEVYYKEANQAEWKHTADTAETTMTVTGLKQGTSYDFKVIAAIGRLKADEAILTNQKTVSVTPTPNPTPTPSPKPTPTLTPSPTPVITGYESGFSYEKRSDDGVTITKYSGNVTVLEIPKKLGGYKVVSIGDQSFRECLSISKVTIPSEVTNIGTAAFHSCYNLTSLIILSETISIGDYAFCGCENLAEIIMGSNITDIGAFAFYNCKKLKSIIFPESIKIDKVGYQAFTHYLEGNASMGSNIAKAFSKCGFDFVDLQYPHLHLRYFDFYNGEPRSLKAWLRRNDIESAVIPDGVNEISFEYCTKLTTVTIPNSATKIYVVECSKLKTIIGSPNSYAEKFAKENGIKFISR